MFDALRWRLIGPHRGGRVVAAVGHPQDRLTYYFGAVDGGVWKTRDAGITWHNVSDGFFHTAAVGALAISPSDPNVLYAGMGESCIRGNVSHGDGVYLSQDGGETWQHRGLQATRHIARVRIHPTDPDVVYVAALGHAFGPHSERGVFRSRDGGLTWTKVLFKSDHTGAIDLAMDPNNPRILYAALWEAHRTPWSLSSGGDESGLYKSTDGGDTWTDISRQNGLPEGVMGRLGVSVSPADSNRIYLSVEADKGGIYRSDDGGAHWQRLNEDRNLRQRAWYYSHIFADPKDRETVYVLNVEFWRSDDGGKTFHTIPTPHGDNHELWIDPNDPQRMITGNDGGASVSLDGGRSWSSILNQPTAQFYHVTTDNQVPYRVYGAQQDNSTLSVPSRSDAAVISNRDWYAVGGGESGYIAVRPDNPDIVYAGNYSLLTRYDHRAHLTTVITPWPELTIGWPAKDLQYRFQWTFPVVISPHDPDCLYAAANVVFRSRDEGQSWEVISPDLSRHDPKTLESSGGPITKDNTAVEYYGTVFSLAESPVQEGLLWSGSDDGLVHLSQDGGKTWTDVTPKLLPEWALISVIEASPHDPGTAYLAATRYKLDDFTPYLLKTTNFGATWELITEGIPGDDFTRVIRQDPVNARLLWAGTETGIYVSLDEGRQWQPFRQNLPVVPIHDLVVKDTDVVLATHGRSFWILDDISALRAMASDLPREAPRLFAPRPAVQMRGGSRFGRAEGEQGYYHGDAFTARWIRVRDGEESRMVPVDAGENPPAGAILNYFLPAVPDHDITLDIIDDSGHTVASFTSAKPDEGSSEAKPAKKTPSPRLPKKLGTNRFVWDMRHAGPTELPGAVLWGGDTKGPMALPGVYQVRLTAGSTTCVEALELQQDPRHIVESADLRERFQLLRAAQSKVSAVHQAILDIRQIREQSEAWMKRAEGHPSEAPLKGVAEPLFKELEEIENQLVQTKAKSFQDVLNFPVMLNAKLAQIGSVIASAPGQPSQQAARTFSDLAERADDLLHRLQQVIDGPLHAFQDALREADLPPIQWGTKDSATPSA